MKRRFVTKQPAYTKLPLLHLACSKDGFRPAMAHVLIDGNHAIATNAHIMVAYNLTGKIDKPVLLALNGKMIHANIWKTLTQIKEHYTLGVEDNFLVVSTSGSIIKYKMAEGLVFPDYKKVLQNSVNRDIENTSVLTINPTLLQILHKVMADSNEYYLPLEFCDNRSPVRVVTHNAIGIIMSVTIEDDLMIKQRFEKFLAK